MLEQYRYNFHIIICSILGVILEFEFDEAKSRASKVEHGIDFVEAQVLSLDDRLLEIPARTSDEPRFLVVGKVGGRHWSAVITYRDDRIRLTSVRRARSDDRIT